MGCFSTHNHARRTIFVDHDLMRLNEAEQVMASCKGMGLSVRHVDASELFLHELAWGYSPLLNHPPPR